MTESLPVVLDTDIGADPDDALALALALASPELSVLGVTVVSGDIELRARMAARLLGMAGRADIPVLRGRRGAIGSDGGGAMLGSEGKGLLDHPYEGPEATILDTPAPEWLVEESRRRPFHLVAIGPLSNVGAALRFDPGLASRLLSLTVMGGVFNEGGLPAAWRRAIDERGPAEAWPDYNTMSDPTAALVCGRSGLPVTWVTVETTLRVPLRRPALARLDGEPLGSALRRMIGVWATAWLGETLPPSEPGADVPADTVCFLHDPLTVAALFPGDWLRLGPATLTYRIEDGLFRLAADPAGAAARVPVDVDGPAFAAFCVERIASLLAER